MSRSLRLRRMQEEPPAPVQKGGWGPNHDQPNPFRRAWEQLKRDAREFPQDFRDEPEEALPRLKRRLDWYMGKDR